MKRAYSIAIGFTVYLLLLFLVLGRPVAAQFASEYETTLEAMGYEDVTISGPKSNTYFYLSLPADWEILDGSYLVLYLDYQVLLSEGAAYPSAPLDVYFNNQLLYTEELSTPVTWQLRVDLSPDYFRLSEDPRSNSIQISFREPSDCQSGLLSSVTIQNASILHLVYRERPLPVELALFPKPIYQRWALEPSHVRFVLPDEFDETDISTAAVIAARLGQLTSHRLPISVTLVSEQPAYAFPGEHLIVIGRPDKNPVIGQLELPVPLAERRLELRSQMPMTVSPGSVFSYTLSVENTTSLSQQLVVEDRFSPASARFVECGASCERAALGKIRWDVGSLAPGQATSTTVTLQVLPAIALDAFVRHTATLFDSGGEILNVDTLTAHIGEKPSSRLVASSQQKSTRFFVHGSQAVSEDAGVIQETVSPWSTRHVVVVVTGLSDEGLLNAARGLNPGNHFPGISGKMAIVEGMHPLSLSVSALPRDITFDLLGYANAELNVLELVKKEYLFDFPAGMTLGEGSHLALHFAHGAIVSTVGGGIKVTLNDVPVDSVYLDGSNLSDAWLHIPLSRMAIRSGLNRINIQTTVDVVDRCIVNVNNPYWLEIYADSFLHFEYQPARTTFDLSRFPYPFNGPGEMDNVLFALPGDPSLMEIEGLLRIASLLGSGSEDKEFIFRVTFGGDPASISLSGSHIVAIGLPTLNPLIHGANAYLPQPFVPDSDDIYQSIDGPVYGIPPGTGLGLVEELVSPWDSEEKHALVAATGTTEEGVHWALSALSEPADELRGNVVLARGDKVYSTDTRPVVVEEVFSMTVSLTPTPAETPVGAAVETPIPPEVSGQLPQTPTSHQISEQAVPGILLTREHGESVSVYSSRPKWLFLLLMVGVLTVVGSIVLAVRKARL